MTLATEARAAYAAQQADQERLRAEREDRERAKRRDWFETILARVGHLDADVNEDGAGPYTVEDNGELGTFQLRVGRGKGSIDVNTLLVVRPCVTCEEDIEERLWETYPDGFLPALGRILQEVPVHVPHCPRDLDEDGLPIPPPDAEGHPVIPIGGGPTNAKDRALFATLDEAEQRAAAANAAALYDGTRTVAACWKLALLPFRREGATR